MKKLKIDESERMVGFINFSRFINSKLQQKHWRLLAILIGVGLAFFVTDRLARFGTLFGPRPIVINNIEAPPLPTLDPTRVAQGAMLYAQQCASCHGVDLNGAPNWKESLADGSLPPPPHTSSGHTWHHKDELLIKLILNGGDPQFKSKMPAFKDKLSEADGMAILDFFKSKWGRQEREFQWWMTTVSDQQ